MRSIYLLFALAIGLFACEGAQEPEFRKVQNVQVQEVRAGNITVVAEAIYFNPNPVGGELSATDIIVKVNGTEVGTVAQSGNTPFEGNSEFSIPLKVTFPLSKLSENKEGFLSSVISAVLNKKVDMEYKGTVTINVLGIDFDVPVDHEEEVVLRN